MREDLKREIEFWPAYDKRPQYGQHCVDLIFYLKGPKGAVQFLLFTGWYPHVIAKPDASWEELSRRAELGKYDYPLPADLGYHSPVPHYEGQSRMSCHVIPGGHCYYDGSGLNANRIFSLLVHEGGEAVWTALEEYYAETFEKEQVDATAAATS